MNVAKLRLTRRSRSCPSCGGECPEYVDVDDHSHYTMCLVHGLSTVLETACPWPPQEPEKKMTDSVERERQLLQRGEQEH